MSAQPASITLGQSSTLSWNTQNATSLDLEPGVGAVAATGSVTVSPQQTTIYTLTVQGDGGTITVSAVVTVTAPAPTATLAASPATIAPGQSSALSWSSLNATSLDLEPGIGAVSSQGSLSVSPQQTTTYTLTATGSGGTITVSATVTVTAPAPTATLAASPTTITAGQSSTLSWNSQNATSLDLEPGIGTVSSQGSISVSPQQTTTYTLTATGGGGTITVTATVTVNQPAGIQLNPGDDIQAAVNGNPTGTTFVLAPGVYRMQIVVPKDGDVFSGQSGATLNGAILIASWHQQSSSVWNAQVSGVTQAASYRGVCDAAHPACIYPEDLFFDSQPLTRVTSLSLVGPGRWYLDYNTDKVYVGSDPGGHVAELSVLRAAFWGSASNVTIKGLTIEKYASVAGKGAVNAMNSLDGSGGPGNNWTVDSNEILLNHGDGVRANNGMIITNNKIHDNGQMGIGGNGIVVLLKNNEVYNNNYAGYKTTWEAGGIKIVTFATQVTIDGNYVHDNNGPGIHVDISDDYVTIENNHTSRNIAFGIHYEISYHGVIKNNLVENDGLPPDGQTGPWYAAGIMVSNSTDVEVSGNTVTNCTNGILGSYADRGVDSKTGVPYTLQNLNVHDNAVTQQAGYAEGIVKASIFDNLVYTSWGNHFQNDTYTLSDPNHAYFYWLGQSWTLAQWQTYASEH